MDATHFNYTEAFSRNIGWVTTLEQQLLKQKKIAIAGMGGVGGSHLTTLARLGIGKFHIADFDTFEIANTNRQAGADSASFGRPKVEVMAEQAQRINPSAEINQFTQGVTQDNLEAFFDGVDLYIDGLDFFALSARKMVFEYCRAHQIPAITAAPLGIGAAALNFLPGKMSFEEYFRLNGHPEQEQLFRFLLGLSPAMLQRGYLVDPSTVDLENHKGPSTIMACQLCSGIASTEALKILLNRGKIYAAPHGVHFDAYRNKLKITWRPWGNNNPIQKIALAIAKKQLSQQGSAPMPYGASPTKQLSIMEKILDSARWAPSGDNAQPWRFEIIDDHRAIIHGHDTRDHCVYDLKGHASQLSLGALLETLTIAASEYQLRANIQRRTDTPEEQPTFEVTLEATPELTTNPLTPFIPARSVQRRPMSTTALTATQKAALESAVGDNFRIVWLEGFGTRLKTAKLLFRNAKLRLTMPEAYETHRNIIQWHAQFSEDKIPDQAIGTDPLTTRLMQWTLQSWQRVSFMNKYMAGTLAPRIQLDFIPGLACAAHFAIIANKTPQTTDDYVEAGRAVQRFWLTVTKLGLCLQPEMTPLIFHEYASRQTHFSDAHGMNKQAQTISEQLQQLIGKQEAERAVFMGRTGRSAQPHARSTRHQLEQLVIANTKHTPQP